MNVCFDIGENVLGDKARVKAIGEIEYKINNNNSKRMFIRTRPFNNLDKITKRR